MTALDYVITAFIIGIPVGFIFGLIFGTMALLEMNWKEGVLFFVGCIIGCPLFLSTLTFILMGTFSIFHPDLTLL